MRKNKWWDLSHFLDRWVSMPTYCPQYMQQKHLLSEFSSYISNNKVLLNEYEFHNMITLTISYTSVRWFFPLIFWLTKKSLNETFLRNAELMANIQVIFVVQRKWLIFKLHLLCFLTIWEKCATTMLWKHNSSEVIVFFFFN